MWAKIIKLVLPFLPQVLIGAGVLGGFIWYSEYQYNRGEKAANARFDKYQEENKKLMDAKFADIANALFKIGVVVDAKQMQADKTGKQSVDVILKQAETNPALKDPNKGMSDEVFNAINAIKQESHQ